MRIVLGVQIPVSLHTHNVQKYTNTHIILYTDAGTTNENDTVREQHLRERTENDDKQSRVVWGDVERERESGGERKKSVSAEFVAEQWSKVTGGGRGEGKGLVVI